MKALELAYMEYVRKATEEEGVTALNYQDFLEQAVAAERQRADSMTSALEECSFLANASLATIHVYPAKDVVSLIPNDLRKIIDIVQEVKDGEWVTPPQSTALDGYEEL